MRIVVAIGGNAITQESQRGTWAEQRANALVQAQQLVSLKLRGHELVLTHGNGPQVGALHLLHALSDDQVPALPLDALVAMTQGQLGYLLGLAIEEVDPSITTVSVLTRVLVDPTDPSFTAPTKPIGRFYDEEEAKRLAGERGWKVAPDAGRGWRALVPSPMPKGIVDVDSIRRLVASGALVIAGGGGGIPVVEEKGGVRGVEAVIDKDRASAELALAVEADLLVLLTAVEHIALDFGTRWQRDMARLTLSDARRLLDRGEFPAGSMQPKVESAIRFVGACGRRAVVTSAARLVDAVEGDCGTSVVADSEGPSLGAVAPPATVVAA
jgi:carbamate kinase